MRNRTPRLQRRVALRLVALFAATTALGCVSGQTGQKLDRSHERATALLHAPAERSRGEPEVDLSAPLERDAVVALAVARSPALTWLAHRVRSLVHAGRAEGSLPTAELGFEVWNLPLERPYSFGEADMYMVDLRQRLPAAGSLDARARALAEEAEALLAELSSEERLVASRAADAFTEYAQALAERTLLERQGALLERMAHAIRARYTTGGAALSDAARLEIELARLERTRARIQGEISRARATLNAVLRRPAEAPLGEPHAAAPETVRVPLDELLNRAAAHRGLRLSAEARVRAAEARREAAEAEAKIPEFLVGLGYWQHPGMRPGLGLSASMSLPWLWGPGAHRVEQAREEEAAERAAQGGAELETQTEVSEAHARLRAIEAQLSSVSRRALGATRRSQEALTAAYTTGNASLLEWVDVTRSVLELEMEIVALEGELSRGITALERAVGAPLPRVPLELAP